MNRRVSSFFRRTSEISEELPQSSPETPDSFDTHFIDEVFKGTTDLIDLSKELLEKLQATDSTVDQVLDVFTSLQPRFTLLTAFVAHLKEAFAALHSLKQHDRISSYLKVLSQTVHKQTVLANPSCHQQPLECCLFLPVEVVFDL